MAEGADGGGGQWAGANVWGSIGGSQWTGTNRQEAVTKGAMEGGGVKGYFFSFMNGPQANDLSPLLICRQQHSGRLQGSATLFRSRSNPRGEI